MAEKSEDERQACLPKRGDMYMCDMCDMAIVVTTDCKCGCDDDEQPCFRCCGAEMSKQP